jgi:hypothetical protein
LRHHQLNHRVVDKGDPTEKLDLVADPEKNFRIIMKAGQVFNNTL